MSNQISVIIPVYNAQVYLEIAVKSVLDQTLLPDEIIIIDDCSTDGTASVIETLVSQHAGLIRSEHLPEQKGAAAARNRGIELSTGSVLTFLDADDVWASTKLETQSRILDADPHFDMVFGYVQQFISPELSDEERAAIRLDHPIMPGLLPGTMAARRSAFALVGSFDETLQIGEFIDWYTRARRLGIVSFMDNEIAVLRRLHRTNLTRRTAEYKDYLRIAKSLIQDRRTISPLPPLLRHIIDTQAIVTPAGKTLPLFAHLDEDNCYVLQYLLKDAHATRILEVGFAYGISAMAISAVVAKLPGLEYHIVDPYQAHLWDNIGIENMRRSGFGDCYTLLNEGSEAALPRLYATGTRLNFAFIDGNHTFDHVLVDFFYTNKMLDINGIVVFDDVTMPSQVQLMNHISTYPAYERVKLPMEITLGDTVRRLKFNNRMAAFRKLDHDQRPWDWHVQF